MEAEKKLKNVEFPFLLTAASKEGKEIGYLESVELDAEIGEGKSDFELTLNMKDADVLHYGCRIYVPETEFGGLAEKMKVSTKTNKITWSGETWRGLLVKKILEPPENEDHIILNGELNECIEQLVGDKFGSLFIVDRENTGVTLKNHKVERFTTLYDAIMKFLGEKGYRLNITYKKPEGPENGAVWLKAEPITDYSNIEYSQDYDVDFDVTDNRRGINHLICAGEGQNQERIVLHLYVQKDGSIGKTQYYKGIDERAALYSFTSADVTKLEEDGIKRLKELQNSKEVNVTVDNEDFELGDIIGGYEQITGTEVRKPIIRKILKISNGKATIEYKVKGDD